MPLAYAASALVLLAGAMTARFFPSDTPSTPPTPIAAAVPDAIDTGAPSQQKLTAASVADLAPTLRSTGIADDVADGAALEVSSMLAKASGDIQLVIDLNGPSTAREMTRLQATRDKIGVVLTAKPDGSYSSEPMEPRLTSGM